MRILAVSHPCVTDVNQQFYAELEALGHQVQLILPANFRTGYSNGAIQVNRWAGFQGGIETRKVGFPESIPLHYYQSDMRPLIVKFRPDVLFVEEEPYALSAWQAFYASRNLPMMRMIYSAQNINKQYPPPFRWMERYVLSRTDAAAVVSSEVGSVLRQKRYQGALFPFPLGVDTRQFQPSAIERATIRKLIGAEDHFVVGYVGRFVEEKGVRHLLEAVKMLDDARMKFVFVGNGDLMEEVRKTQAQFPEHVWIADQIKHNEVHQWMNTLDILVLPSLTKPNWKEQFGRVIIESMACGVPVLGSDSGEIPKLIRQTGGGWICREGDTEDLAAALLRLAADVTERRHKAEIGLKSVQSSYSKQMMAKTFEQEIVDFKKSNHAKRDAN
ncbi:N-acetyl-alpha-D-glucosaminyl L-malate synthase [Paenibacillus solanacearum]|uniref:N-acetyl-alpha-D-glucosaminyl L-malate synthase n=1 Tax=Paenibacillus solanacearum TaxID=2048548 RepID=A0A916NHC3_9BACL|nr:glycosyltransferase [Paenibacillus solanacearum]CAG7613354.1 N-acetyl-alpha-D-glucosaminyl L-malate synthase [Paenibacillus solanacearum]